MEQPEYTCVNCRRTFTSDWSEEEADAEAEKNFPGVASEDMVVVCDECFQSLRALND